MKVLFIFMMIFSVVMPLQSMKYRIKNSKKYSIHTNSIGNKDNKIPHVIQGWNKIVTYGFVGTLGTCWVGFNSLSSYSWGVDHEVINSTTRKEREMLERNNMWHHAEGECKLVLIQTAITEIFLSCLLSRRSYPRGGYTASQVALFIAGRNTIGKSIKNQLISK